METVKMFYEVLGKDNQMQERAKELDLGQSQDKETAVAALITFAEREGYSFTAEEAQAYFENRHRGEVPDEELDGIAGGMDGSKKCTKCGNPVVLAAGDVCIRCLWFSN
jgi:hypothetical protein